MKIIINRLKYIVLTLILVVFILNIKLVINSTYDACVLFFNKVFISVFPFIVLCDLLIFFNYHLFIKKVFGKVISHVFNISSNSSIVFILSMLTSHPGNAIYIKKLLDEKIIDEECASKILVFSYFPSLSFVIGVIGVSLYNSFMVGVILWVLVFINNVMIGLFLRDKKRIKDISVDKVINNNDFFTCFKDSIVKGVNTLVIILGNLIVFSIIVSLINEYITVKPYILSILTGTLELTSGVMSISRLSVPFNIKFALTSFVLNFSGLSILFQSFSILSNYKINIKKTLTIKLMFSIIMFLVILICTRWI